MEVVYFIAFVVLCAIVVLWAAASSRNKKNTELARRLKAKSAKAQGDLLTTPSHYVLSHRDQVWRSKRRRSIEDVTATNRYVPRSESAGQTEYDGYSRRDRHHVIVGTAHIKEEDHITEPETTKTGYRESKTSG